MTGNGGLEESVFLIEHLLESILGRCDRQTVLNSRLVSRRWAYYGSKELQKNVSISFSRWYSTVQIKSHEPPGSPDDLIALMHMSPEFPCTSFEFWRMNLSPEELASEQSSTERFLNAHGASVKKAVFHGVVHIDELKQLLLSQAPNLQQLHLGVMIDVKYSNATEAQSIRERKRLEASLVDRNVLANLTNSKSESLFLGLPSLPFDKDEAAGSPKPILKNLKIFKCSLFSELPRIFIQQILECSPHLVDVTLPEDCLYFLVTPINRLHLLSKLVIYMFRRNMESLELFANHLQDNLGHCAVRELVYHRNNCEFVNFTTVVQVDTAREFYERGARVMKKVFNAVSATCQKLVLKQEIKNFQIPRMPRVKHLTIQYYSDEVTQSPVSSLGDGLSLGDTFPNLKSLEIGTRMDLKGLVFPKIFRDEDPVSAANVEKVTLKLRRPGQRVVKSFQVVFPNAQIRRKAGILGNSVFGSDEESDIDEADVAKIDDAKSDDNESDYYENVSDENALIPARSWRQQICCTIF